jgi:hypothetical protein
MRKTKTRKPLPDLALFLWLAFLTGLALCAFVGFVYLWSLL